MPRLARVLAVDTPYHVTQRGNARRAVFETDSDRLVYLSLLQEFARLYRLNILGYCLMRNHVHLIALPRRLDSMPRVLRCTHGRYAAYLNARKAASGHVWQGRYYSCPMDENYRWSAEEWREFLACARGAEQEAEQIRQSTHNGRPLGSLDFIRQLEQGTGRLLTASKGGRPRRPLPDPGQARLAFAAESGDGR